jgi:hypothetical protein
MAQMSDATTRRRLTRRETEVLQHLLSVETSGEAEAAVRRMRRQLAEMMVVEEWLCCPSIDLVLGDEHIADEVPPMIEARHRTKPYELLLFPSVDDGVRTLELVHYTDDQLREFPPPDEWHAPTPLWFKGKPLANG